MEGRALYGPGSKEREKLQAAMANLVSGKRNIDVTSKAIRPIVVSKDMTEIAW